MSHGEWACCVVAGGGVQYIIVELTLQVSQWGCGGFLGLVYAKRPKLSRYWTGLSEPSETLVYSF
jgi:hypothetical protein